MTDEELSRLLGEDFSSRKNLILPPNRPPSRRMLRKRP